MTEDIEDYYGTKISVQPVMASPGPMVDLERLDPLAHCDDDGETFDRLTPQQARDLAERLKKAANESEGS